MPCSNTSTKWKPLVKTSLLLAALIGSASIAAAQAPSGAAQDLNVYRGAQVSPEVERIYEKGLRWLAANQLDDGGFPGQYGSEAAVASLSMLAMLAHGDDPNHGKYAKTIKRCLDKVLNSTNASTGYIGNSMYNHGFSTLGLAEAYGAVRDDRIAPALQKAVDLILTSQSKNPTKAWRYMPESQDGDSTVSGACFVALVAARNSGLKVPDKAVDDALQFYIDCQNPSDGGIAYLPRMGSHGGCTTAIGVACFAYARQKDKTAFQKAFKHMKDQSEGSASYPFYFEYYAAQAYFQSDVAEWKLWNDKLVKRFAEMQSDDGSWDGGMGPATSTCLGLLSLALNYRFLPIYER
jgi:Family of unknown function (DUF6288)